MKTDREFSFVGLLSVAQLSEPALGAGLYIVSLMSSAALEAVEPAS